ncbi:MAG: recombinase family protein [Defluviitaleaceae bacterium]|nr:recombinase family protein [Defluviitaleaceae bacterium]MCL2238412.1 recombinase family protein [Defluviitaleaceae bacterium]
MRIYNVGIYARLSQENKNKANVNPSGCPPILAAPDEDSVSIENQIFMLTQFINMMPGWIETRTYIDDGASGSNFQRQGFIDMMEDVRSGVINLVLVKDLSRFGRNYLEAGRYLEEELPALGCRFVAISDNIDTETGETDIMTFLNAINDYFVRNTSDRIKSVMLAKAKDGQKLSGAVPYGYDRNPNARTRLIVDEYAAAVVRKVFALRVEGMGYNAIAGVLNKEGITPPRRYYFQRRERSSLRSPASLGCAWTNRTIKLMLCNEIYLGHTVSMKRGTRSYRDSRAYYRDESEWVRVENTHPPLVDIVTWNKVQRLNKVAKETSANHQESQQSLFSGLLICLGCNSKMGYTKRMETKKDGRIVDFGAYVCQTYMRSGCVVCSSHRINERSLKALVISNVREAASKVTCDEAAMYESLQRILLGERKAKKAEMAKEKRRLEQQLYGFDNRIAKLYDARAEGLLAPEDFYTYISEIEMQREAMEKRLSSMGELLREVEANVNDISKWISLIKDKSATDEVDRDLLESLIDRIEIGGREASDGVPSQIVRIFYKYLPSHKMALYGMVPCTWTQL